MRNKVVTICGSMRFAKQMIEIAAGLERKYGWCVVQCVYCVDIESITNEEMENIINAHRQKIDISDAIYVVNINGYIGSSTNSEIRYAIEKGKEVIYHETREKENW